MRCTILPVLASDTNPEECSGRECERYDYGTDYVGSSWLQDDSSQHICTSTMYSANVAQLFTPPRVPWKYTSVCFAVRLPRGSADPSLPREAVLQGAVSLYPVTVFTGGDMLYPGERSAYATFEKRVVHTPRAPTARHDDFDSWLQRKTESERSRDNQQREWLRSEHERRQARLEEDRQMAEEYSKRENGWDLHVVALPTRKADWRVSLVFNAAHPEWEKDLVHSSKQTFDPMAPARRQRAQSMGYP
eukprot:m51a1_g3760 hypothetical protein (247) ;mRNA; r:110748-114244